MSAPIVHTGLVKQIEGARVSVTITSQSACGTCHARQACGLAETQEKIVDVVTPDAAQFSVGEEVVVGVRRRIGALSVGLAYVGALVVLLVVLFVGIGLLDWTERAAAWASLVGVVLYYGVLWLFRKKIENSIQFTITKI